MRITGRTESVTVGDVRSGSVQAAVDANDAGNIFRHVKGSPPYFTSTQKDLFSLCRFKQHPAQIWFTLSANPTERFSLLSYVTGKSIIQLKTMTFYDRAQIVNNNPVIFVRYWHRQINFIFNYLLKKKLFSIKCCCSRLFLSDGSAGAENFVVTLSFHSLFGSKGSSRF
eukprot:Lithocolla_globosa_v1_NODE_1228_length_2756_cov_44.691596.p3 type:complete len:169 gc:universal NODE_1228_length_2756_cov_44.691596:899-1405(+)